MYWTLKYTKEILGYLDCSLNGNELRQTLTQLHKDTPWSGELGRQYSVWRLIPQRIWDGIILEDENALKALERLKIASVEELEYYYDERKIIGTYPRPEDRKGIPFQRSFDDNITSYDDNTEYSR